MATWTSSFGVFGLTYNPVTLGGEGYNWILTGRLMNGDGFFHVLGVDAYGIGNEVGLKIYNMSDVTIATIENKQTYSRIVAIHDGSEVELRVFSGLSNIATSNLDSSLSQFTTMFAQSILGWHNGELWQGGEIVGRSSERHTIYLIFSYHTS